MKAAVWYACRDIRVENVEEVNLGKDMVKIKVSWCGICGSDLHEYAAGPLAIPFNQPHCLTGQVAPLIMGHEFSGIVEGVGNNVTTVAVGDKVTIEPIISCRKCPQCLKGNYNLCPYKGYYGISENGGFAEFVAVKESAVHKLPINMTLEKGALVEPTAVAVNAIRQSSLKLGDSCAVFGAGPIGLLAIQAAKAAGASEIIVVEVSESRLELAREMGATHLVNPMNGSAIDQIRDICKDGVDICFEVAGVEATLLNAVDAIKTGGEVVIISLWEMPVTLNMSTLVRKECKFTPVIAYRHIFPQVISLIANNVLNIDPIITSQIKLDNIVDDGFEILLKDKSHSKILVSP